MNPLAHGRSARRETRALAWFVVALAVFELALPLLVYGANAVFVHARYDRLLTQFAHRSIDPNSLDSLDGTTVAREHGAQWQWALERPYDSDAVRSALEWLDSSVPTLAEGRHLIVRAGDKDLMMTSVPLDDAFATLFAADMSEPLSALRSGLPVQCALAGASAAITLGLGLFLVGRVRQGREAAERLFANASHELRTPLAVIAAEASRLSSDSADAVAVGEAIEAQSGRMGLLVDDILALSRSDAKDPEPVFSPMDLRECAYDAASSLEPLAAQEGKSFHVELASQMPAASDASMAATILTNLLANALRHCATRVDVAGEDSDDRWTLVVKNDGAPIDDEAAARAFDRHYSGPDGSTGIGLCLARTYADALGATVTLGSEDGRTVARLVLPKHPR